MKNNTRHNRGFTAAETIVAIAIVALIGIAIATFQSEIFRKERTTRSRIMAIEDARLTLRRFSEEARNISHASNDAYAIALADATEFTFYADTNNDNLKKRFHYFVENDALKREIVQPSGTPVVYTSGERVTTMVKSLASPVQPIFTYYDTTEAALTNPAPVASVRSVRMLITTSVISTDSLSTTTTQLETRATLRNLKDNY